LKVEHRKGTFTPLDHKNEGYVGHNMPTPANTKNTRCSTLALRRTDSAVRVANRWA